MEWGQSFIYILMNKRRDESYLSPPLTRETVCPLVTSSTNDSAHGMQVTFKKSAKGLLIVDCDIKLD